MNAPAFSVAICTYNGAKTISRAIDAILVLEENGTLLKELLLIDNASKDNTKDICLSYAEKDSRVKYLYEKEAGLSNARRCAVQNASGDWLVYVDDDNVLDKRWLVELAATIEKNPEAGIINGASLAVAAEPLDEDEEMRLSLLYKSLACTHLKGWDEPASPLSFPFGAGMCIKIEPLRKILSDGWLSLSGRKGASLASGEDTELATKCLSLGYTFVYNDKMRLEHLIPKARLSRDYANRLIKGLTEGWYANVSAKKLYIVHRFLRGIKYAIVLLAASLQKNSKNRYKKERSLQNIVRAKTFLKCIMRDWLLRRT